jgi:hypothetical protein
MLRLTSVDGSLNRFLAVGIVTACLAPAAHAGTVTILSQERRVVASAEDGAGTQSDDTKMAPDAGPFNDTASADASGANTTFRSSASMNSTLGQDGLFFKGTLNYDIQPAAGGPQGDVVNELGIDVTFSVDQAYNYVLTIKNDIVKSDPNTDSAASSILRRVDDPNAGGFPVTDSDASGVMDPGTYNLSIIRGAMSFGVPEELTSHQVDYDYSLALSPVDGTGGGGGEPNPIPLPPAVWSGLLVLGAGALNRLRKRRIA